MTLFGVISPAKPLLSGIYIFQLPFHIGHECCSVLCDPTAFLSSIGGTCRFPNYSTCLRPSTDPVPTFCPFPECIFPYLIAYSPLVCFSIPFYLYVILSWLILVVETSRVFPTPYKVPSVLVYLYMFFYME